MEQEKLLKRISELESINDQLLTEIRFLDQLLRQVAAEHPATVRVEDFGAMLCPGGVFTADRNGVQIRDGDGVHIVPTPAAGQWLAAHVLPTIVQGGRSQMAGRSLVVPSAPTTTPRPSVSASGAVAAGTRGP